MLIELSIAATGALNITAWLVIQLGLAWLANQVRIDRFDASGLLAREKRWERAGRFYERWCRIKSWKDKLPDAGRWLSGGFSKAQLRDKTKAHLERFARETWRGELVHWLALLCLPVFCVWNPWWGVLVNAAVAVALNLPCIFALRYNRARFQRLLALLNTLS